MSRNDTIVFPGQGSQRVGMAKDFADQYPESRAVFQSADAALGFSLTSVCHDDDDDARLDQTEYTQPAILTAEIAMFVAAQTRYGLAPAAFAGHSLGEYAALVAAGAMPFEVALRLVHLRGRLMQRAVAADKGSMVALSLKTALPTQSIRDLARRHDVDVANENSPNQMVLSGEKAAIGAAVDAIVVAIPEIRATSLTVSAPFHSRQMRVIEPEFRAALQQERPSFDSGAAKAVTSNRHGVFHSGRVDDLIDSLTEQISHPVLWVDNMKAVAALGSEIIEMGPNRPLRKFFKALGYSVSAIVDVRSARRVFGASATTTPSQEATQHA